MVALYLLLGSIIFSIGFVCGTAWKSICSENARQDKIIEDAFNQLNGGTK